MSIDRTTIIAGPAIVQFNGATFYTEGDITAKPTINRFDINSSMFGKVDERMDTVIWEISFTPMGQNFHTSAVSAVLWPYLNPTIGSSMFGATDKDVIIDTLAGEELAFQAGCIVSMPDMNLSATKTPVGQVTMHCIGMNDTAMSGTGKYYQSTAMTFSDASFDPADILTLPYSAALGSLSSPWNDIETEEGWTISFDTSYDTIKIDSDGIVDYRLQSVGITAKCKPLGMDEDAIVELLKIQGTGVRRGMSLLDNANDLVIQDSAGTAGNPIITLKNACPVESGFVFGNGSTLRHGELAFTSMRSFTAGAAGALATIGEIAAA